MCMNLSIAMALKLRVFLLLFSFFGLFISDLKVCEGKYKYKTKSYEKPYSPFAVKSYVRMKLREVVKPRMSRMRFLESYQPTTHSLKVVIIRKNLEGQTTGVFIRSVSEEEFQKLKHLPYHKVYALSGQTISPQKEKDTFIRRDARSWDSGQNDPIEGLVQNLQSHDEKKRKEAYALLARFNKQPELLKRSFLFLINLIKKKIHEEKRYSNWKEGLDETLKALLVDIGEPAIPHLIEELKKSEDRIFIGVVDETTLLEVFIVEVLGKIGSVDAIEPISEMTQRWNSKEGLIIAKNALLDIRDHPSKELKAFFERDDSTFIPPHILQRFTLLFLNLIEKKIFSLEGGQSFKKLLDWFHEAVSFGNMGVWTMIDYDIFSDGDIWERIPKSLEKLLSIMVGEGRITEEILIEFTDATTEWGKKHNVELDEEKKPFWTREEEGESVELTDEEIVMGAAASLIMDMGTAIELQTPQKEMVDEAMAEIDRRFGEFANIFPPMEEKDPFADFVSELINPSEVETKTNKQLEIILAQEKNSLKKLEQIDEILWECQNYGELRLTLIQKLLKKLKDSNLDSKSKRWIMYTLFLLRDSLPDHRDDMIQKREILNGLREQQDHDSPPEPQGWEDR